MMQLATNCSLHLEDAAVAGSEAALLTQVLRGAQRIFKCGP